MRLILNTQKVLRAFNGHPERGVACHWLPKKRVTVGVRWSLPHKDYVPDDDVHVTPHIALRLIRRHPDGMSEWELIINPEHRQQAVEWLLLRCR